jgi:DMSO/TMAO reductase YedYZ heme-binding membrane subunit
MVSTTDSLTTRNHFFTFLTFLLSLLVGMIGGGILIGAIWFLVTRTTLAPQLGAFLGITDKTPWHLSRSAGTVAYLLLAGSTVWGLLLSSKIVKEALPAALSLAMHNILSWLALAFTAFHGLVLLFDNYYTYTLSNLTIPFTGPYRPGWVGLGIIGFYLMLLIALSFQFRKKIGQKRWRTLHYLSFAVFVMATVHGLAAGTDSIKLSMQIMYLACGLLVFFLGNYRLLTGLTSDRPQPSRSRGSISVPGPGRPDSWGTSRKASLLRDGISRRRI